MLLPSALSCGYTALQQPEPQRQRPSRPKLPSFERYDPYRRSQSPVYGLIASCRALQSMLGERLVPSPTPSPSLDATMRAMPMASPFGEPTPPPVQAPAPRGINKRRRDTFEGSAGDQLRDATIQGEHRPLFSTPKRRRIVPLDLPPGLLAHDFEALDDSSPLSVKTPVQSYPSPRIELPMVDDLSRPLEQQGLVSSWTENDDRMLVETVLSKLNLSTQEWNDCAQRLGKDKDSLDHRWHLLLGEGNIGLRRGVGRMGRMELDIKSW